jgi:hypothetical protein
MSLSVGQMDKRVEVYSVIAQSVEQWTVNPSVPGSSPGHGANLAGGASFAGKQKRTFNLTW